MTISAEKSPIMDCIDQPFSEANSPYLVKERVSGRIRNIHLWQGQWQEYRCLWSFSNGGHTCFWL